MGKFTNGKTHPGKPNGGKTKSVKPAARANVWRNRIVGYGNEDPRALKANDANWRLHPAAQADALEGALTEIGWIQDIIVNLRTSLEWRTPERNVKTTLDGHLRVERAIARNESTVPVKYVDLTPQEELTALATFDPLSAMAQTDGRKLQDALARIQVENAGLQALTAQLEQQAKDAIAALGANKQEETADAEPKTDKAEQLQKEWKTASGQMWQIGSHRLLIADCTLKENRDRLTAGETIALLLTDPPYGINVVDVKKFRAADGGAKLPTFGTVRAKGAYAFGGLKSARANSGARGKVDATLYRPVHGDDKPFDPSHLFGLAKKMILFGGNYYASKLPDSRHWIVWDKNMTGTFADAELAWSDFETGVKLYRHTWNGMQREGERRLESVTRVHPNQKPVGLLSQILQDHSEQGDLILDLYGGSGSVVLACENTGRVCRMMEIDAAYGAVILQRMSDAFPQIEIERLSPRRVPSARVTSAQVKHGKQAKQGIRVPPVPPVSRRAKRK